jgi:hypothetical protein
MAARWTGLAAAGRGLARAAARSQEMKEGNAVTHALPTNLTGAGLQMRCGDQRRLQGRAISEGEVRRPSFKGEGKVQRRVRATSQDGRGRGRRPRTRTGKGESDVPGFGGAIIFFSLDEGPRFCVINEILYQEFFLSLYFILHPSTSLIIYYSLL